MQSSDAKCTDETAPASPTVCKLSDYINYWGMCGSLSGFTRVSLSWLVKVKGSEHNTLLCLNAASSAQSAAVKLHFLFLFFFYFQVSVTCKGGWSRPEREQWGWEVEANRERKERQTAAKLEVFTPGKMCRATAPRPISGWSSIERSTTSPSGPRGTQEGFESSTTMLERMLR